jgi:hypothetical protein
MTAKVLFLVFATSSTITAKELFLDFATSTKRGTRSVKPDEEILIFLNKLIKSTSDFGKVKRR